MKNKYHILYFGKVRNRVLYWPIIIDAESIEQANVIALGRRTKMIEMMAKYFIEEKEKIEIEKVDVQDIDEYLLEATNHGKELIYI